MALHTLADGNLLAISGMGPQAASQAALALAAAGARALLSFGLAGALDPALDAGTVLLPVAVMDGAGTVHATCASWRQQLAARVATLPAHRGRGRAAVGGTLLSSAQPLTSALSKSQAWQGTGACAVDMESFAIASVAVAQGIDFAIARVVVDTAVDALPRSVTRATGPRGEVAVPRLLAGLLCRPTDSGALLRLSRRYRAAMRCLRDLAQRGVGIS